MTAIRWAAGVATFILACAAWQGAEAAGDKDSPRPIATSQPGKVFCKLVIGSTQGGPAGVGSEPWIVKATTEDGSPIASDCSGWAELSPKAQQLEAPQLIGLSYQGACKRDAASNLLVIGISGSGKKSLVLLDQVGQRDAFQLDRLPDGRAVFVAVEVVELSAARPAVQWGEPVNNVRMHLKIEPADWPRQAGIIQFTGVFENLGPTQMMAPMWAGHAVAPLEFTGPDGKAVAPKAQNNAVSQPVYSGTGIVFPGRTTSAPLRGEWADGTLAIVSASTATTWKWRLPPGQYQVRAVTAMQDYYYGNNQNPPGAKSCVSQPVAITVTAPGAASKPDGK